MRLTTLIALLPAVAFAQEQVPLQDKLSSWLGKAKSYIPSAPANPVDAGAANVAKRQVTELTATNWQNALQPSTFTNTAGPENWMVLVTGGNKTCQGKCLQLNAEWNKTAALFSADKNAPHMGLIDCDNEGVLCSTWFAGPPSLWYIQLPVVKATEQTPAQTDIYVKHLNLTTTRATDLIKFHKEQQWKEMEPIDSVFHPFNGALAKYGVQVPLGHILYFFSLVPSWSIMLFVSFVTRHFMSKRAGTPEQGAYQRRQGANANSPPGTGAPATKARK